MQKVALTLGLLIFGGCLLWAQKAARTSAPRFEPARVLSTTEAHYPVSGTAWGTVVLQVTVDESGQIKDVSVLRDIPGLTDVAKDAVKKWKFNPATFRGRPITTPVVVAFSFSAPMLTPGP